MTNFAKFSIGGPSSEIGLRIILIFKKASLYSGLAVLFYNSMTQYTFFLEIAESAILMYFSVLYLMTSLYILITVDAGSSKNSRNFCSCLYTDSLTRLSPLPCIGAKIWLKVRYHENRSSYGITRIGRHMVSRE